MRPIDGDILLEQFKTLRDNWDTKNATHRAVRGAFVDCILRTQDAPTVDTEPVKHGQWIFKSKINLVSTGKLFVSKLVYTPQTLGETEWCEIPRGKYFFEKKRHEAKVPYCSICGVRGGDDWYDKTPYCPNCGAKMDLENGENINNICKRGKTNGL